MSAVSWATWLLFTAVPARCVLLRVPCPGPLGSCSLVCPLVALCCVCGVLGNLAPVHRCARLVLCVACAVSWTTWLLFTLCDLSVRCVALRVRCRGPIGSCSPGESARRVVLCVRCPGPLCSCSPVCPLDALCWVCGILNHLAPVHRCAYSMRCVACAVSWAAWLLFTGVPARCVVLRVRCPGPLGSCSPVCLLGALCWVCGVLGHLAPVHRCARSVHCVACAVSWATWLPFSGVPARCVVLRVRCPGPLGSCSPVCPLGALCCVCGVSGYLAPVPWLSWCLPLPRTRAPGLSGRLRGAPGGRRGTGLMAPAAGPCRDGGAGLHLHPIRSGPSGGVVPCGSLRRRSRAACAAVVLRVLTRSLTRPVSCTVRLSTGTSAGAPGLFCVDGNMSPFGS